MKKINLFLPGMTSILILAGVMNSKSVQAYQLSAGVREFYSSNDDNGFGSDGGAKMKMAAFETGVGSMTMQLRLGAMDRTASTLFQPTLRSSRDSIEIAVSRIAHGDGVAVFKPMIFQNPNLGTPSAITEMNPSSGDSLLASYDQLLNVYRSIATARSIDEFVLGAGLGKTYSSTFATRWKSILSNLRHSLGNATTLSLELSSETALNSLEHFKESDPGLFFDTWSDINEIRFTLPVQKYLDSRSLTLNRNSLHELILNRIQRIHSLLPNRKVALSNVILPSCANFTAEESEVECPAHFTLTAEGMKAQTEAMALFFQTLKSIDDETGQALQSVELLFANTQPEPLWDQADPRFFLYNPTAHDLITEQLKTEHHHSSLVSSLAKSFLPDLDDTPKKKACIYFDELNSKDTLGPIHARMLENLIGAFPKWRRERRSVVYYQAHDLDDCDVVFYLASNFVLEPPATFYSDLANYMQSHTVTWFNYRFDQFAKTSKATLSFNVPYMMQPDLPPSRHVQDPGFFRYFDYKGETFEKLAYWNPIHQNIYSNSPELARIEVQDPTKVSILATARHSQKDINTPYAVREDFQNSDPAHPGSLYYFADLPFSFVHREDRYFIFCDVLWDILKETPPDRKPVALVRLEDINPAMSPENLTWVTDYLADRNVPFSMAVIPLYSNLFFNPTTGKNAPIWKPVDQYPAFVGNLKYAKARGAEFVFHGVAHQAGDLISGYEGVSAADYEFWSWPKDEPLPQDDPTWAIKRLELGESVFLRLGMRPRAWEVPHYAGSALDYLLFGKLFEWNYHLSLLFKSEVDQDAPLTEKHLFFHCLTTECRDERLKIASRLKVEADYSTFGGQVIPYPVYRDSYGQGIIPETLGMIDFHSYTPNTWRQVSFPEDLLRRAKKLKVIRGAMASFFWHPTILDRSNVYYNEVPGSFEKIGGKITMIKMIDGLRALGYEFRSIADCDLFPRKDCPKN